MRSIKTTILTITICGLLCILAGTMQACDLVDSLVPASTPGPTVTPYADLFRPTEEERLIQVHFTCGTRADCNDEELLGLILADIANARESVHVAMYNINLPVISEALIAAQERGLDVGVVMETDKMDGEEPQRMLQYGVNIVGDDGDGLMHDKFIIIDGSLVWMGSLNLTDTSVYSDDNNFVRIESQQFTANYELEFEEMFVDRQFGEYSPSTGSNQLSDLNGIAAFVFFSPEDNVQEKLLEMIQAAQVNVYFLAFTMTQDDLADALIEADSRGVDVRGVFEMDKVEDEGSEYLRLEAANIDVRLDGNPAAMHHKVIIIDNEVAVFGSYNFTSSAEHWNDENIGIVSDPVLAGQFLAEFERIFADAAP